jgi:hypothetical protein
MQIGLQDMQIWGTVPILLYFWRPNDEAAVTVVDYVLCLSRPNDEASQVNFLGVTLRKGPGRSGKASMTAFWHEPSK